MPHPTLRALCAHILTIPTAVINFSEVAETPRDGDIPFKMAADLIIMTGTFNQVISHLTPVNYERIRTRMSLSAD